MTDAYLYHITDTTTGVTKACGQSYGMITNSEERVNCATCKTIIEGRKIEKANKEFEQQLWVFTAVNYDTGAESVLYGHATYTVFEQALAQAHHENSWLKTEKYIPPTYTCDFYGCSGLHPSRENYCSFSRRAGRL